MTDNALATDDEITVMSMGQMRQEAILRSLPHASPTDLRAQLLADNEAQR